jgi:hypothetical protein
MQKKNSNLTTFALLTTLTLVTWIFIEAYQRFYKANIQTVPPAILSPLTPILDSAYLDELEKRRQISDEEIAQYKQSSPIKLAPSTSEAQQQTNSTTDTVQESTTEGVAQ